MHAIDRFFENSADAVVGVNKYQQIFLWNHACERLFGVPFDQVRGRKCYDVVAGRDLDENMFCRPDCPLFAKALGCELIADYDLVIQGAERDPVAVNVGFFVTPAACRDETDLVVIHVFRYINSYRLIKRLAADRAFGAQGLRACKFNLTARETEILELTTKGLTTASIANELFISETTVRNHLKHIFSKSFI